VGKVDILSLVGKGDFLSMACNPKGEGNGAVVGNGKACIRVLCMKAGDAKNLFLGFSFSS
jgi:hypothetical protein